MLHGCLVLSSTVRGTPALASLLSQHGRDFRVCCDAHDKCYGTCGAVKGNCDRVFVGCLLQVCSTTSDAAVVDACQPMYRFTKDALAQRALAKGTALFSCQAFLLAQEGACDCGDNSEL